MWALGRCCHPSEEITMFRAALTVAFFGAYRVSKTVSPAKDKAGDSCIRYEDIQLEWSHILLWLRK